MDNLTLRLGNAERHFWLTRSVARVMGLNLSEAMHENRLSVQEYGEMVTRCRTCGAAEDCELWLATRTGPNATGPTACLNAQLLQSLRKTA